MPGFALKMTAATHVGLVRTNNEDNFIICPDLVRQNWTETVPDRPIPLGKKGALMVVADGMGGMNAGEVASELAVNSLKESFSAMESLPGDIGQFLKDAIVKADKEIKDYIEKDCSTSGMGTTVVLCWLLGSTAHIAWCGDSRAYLFNRQTGLIRLSKDHSYVQELVDKGELSAELMHDHPLSNVITRCLGDVDNRANPETRIYQLHNDDIIMLCSDGLCGICHDDQILDVMINHNEDPIECKNELISAALSAGGYDNVTVALARIQTDEEEEETAAEEETAEEENTEEDKKEELSTTIRSDIRRRSHKLRNFMLFLLILIIAGGAYIWFTPSCSPLKDQITTTVTNTHGSPLLSFLLSPLLFF